MRLSRRQALGLFLVGLLMSSGISGLLRNRPGPLEIRPLPGVPGYRYLSGGAISGGLPDPFIGLDATPEGPAGDLRDLHTAMAAPGQVPVAVFTDYNCPYCRVLTKRLAEIADTGAIAVTWHELPLLGPMSVTAARAAIAADLQGAYLPFHRRMMQARFRPSPPNLLAAAEDLGIDGPRLLAEMDGPVVTNRLRRSAGLAEMFGIFGTPALVVGRTLVLGDISPGDPDRLIELERSG